MLEIKKETSLANKPRRSLPFHINELPINYIEEIASLWNQDTGKNNIVYIKLNSSRPI